MNKEILVNQDTPKFLEIMEVALTHYVGVGFLMILALGFYFFVYPYQINEAAKTTLEYLVLGYLIIAPFYYFYISKEGKINSEKISRSLLAAKFIWQLPLKIMKFLIGKNDFKSTFAADQNTKQAVLVAIVKFFFAPIMISYFFVNLNTLLSSGHAIISWFSKITIHDPVLNIWGNIYSILIGVIFIIDTIIFAFAYLVESDKLGNKIKSVEPTFGGWIVALICYPPFNRFTFQGLFLLGLIISKNRGPHFGSWFIILFQSIATILFIVYVWASIALGLKVGNLVNRGVVDTGPYRYVRHPAYAAKNLAWFFELIPYFNHPFQLLIWLIWAMIYLLRALTEERHLKSDPDYVEYCKRTRYRFIPGLI